VSVDGAPCVYLAGPDGFTAAGLRWHRQQVIPVVRGAGLEPLSPWDGRLGEELERIVAMPPGPERQRQLETVDYHIGAANAALIERSRGVLALLDGPDVDSGTAAEIGYAAKSGCLIVGLRTDLRRTGDNEGVTVNLQVEYFIRVSGGSVQVGLDAAVSELARLLGVRPLA
jgi:nucleoside 2-deoxyribosyltransferase